MVCLSKVNNFEQLCELILLEAFKHSLPNKCVVHLNEQKVHSIAEAAMLNDKFDLMHKTALSLPV